MEKGETKGKQIAKLEQISTFFEKVLNITTKTLNIFWGEIGDLEKCKKKGKQIPKSEKNQDFFEKCA